MSREPTAPAFPSPPCCAGGGPRVLGFLRVEHGPLVTDFGLDTDSRGNLLVDDDSFATSAPGVFAAGDSVLGASLVVRALALGRRAAAAIHHFLRP